MSMQNNVAKMWVAVPKWLKISLGSFIMLFLLAFFVVGWLVSSKVLKVASQTVAYDQTIEAISGNNYTISGGAYNITAKPKILTLYE